MSIKNTCNTYFVMYLFYTTVHSTQLVCVLSMLLVLQMDAYTRVHSTQLACVLSMLLVLQMDAYTRVHSTQLVDAGMMAVTTHVSVKMLQLDNINAHQSKMVSPTIAIDFTLMMSANFAVIVSIIYC